MHHRSASFCARVTACWILLLSAETSGGCGANKSATPAKEPAVAKHEHHAPHGGTAVVLGDEVYHIEFVLEPGSGKMQAYILDGEMENFIRTDISSFEVVASTGGEKRTLLFKAVADAATGEKVGDTALFEAEADWLSSIKMFDGVLTEITIRGSRFDGVKFNFPRGNDHD